MGRVFEDNAASIGRTPLVRINNLTKGAHATVLAKDRGAQPFLLGQVPDRRRMVWDAEKRGALKPGKADHRGDQRQTPGSRSPSPPRPAATSACWRCPRR